MKEIKENYLIIIKTDKYTGNFERELCAYSTGIVGDCDVGEEEAEMFNEKYPNKEYPEVSKFEDLVTQRPDEHGCYRPVSISELDSNAIDIYFEGKPNQEELDLIFLRAEEYCNQHDIKVLYSYPPRR